MIRFLTSTDGERFEAIEPAPLGSPVVWIALDSNAQRALCRLLQASKVAASIRDRKRVMPLAFMSALDGLRFALREMGGLQNALDPSRDVRGMRDSEFDNWPSRPTSARDSLDEEFGEQDDEAREA